MKVEVKIDKTIKEPYVLIYTNQMNEHIKNIVNIIDDKPMAIAATLNEKTFILKPENIFLIQVNEGMLDIYDINKTYRLNERLYEIKKRLNAEFIQISKGSIINMRYVESVEASFSGSLKVHLKNGLSDYISRSYTKTFKAYLGI